MSALLLQLGLITESEIVPMGDVMRVAAALQKQVTRDLAPIWDVSATVDAFETLEDVPLGYWPMIIMDDIGYDAAGIHLDKDRQPFALIMSDPDIDVWSLTASHEAIEMLVDPFGDRLVAGDSTKPDQGRVNFLVEVCGPSEAAEFAYTVNGALVSDFYTPRFFDPIAAPGVRYSFTGAVKAPRDVLKGGYLSWHDPLTDHWWQETWFSGNASRFRDLGVFEAANGSFRSQIDRITGQATADAVSAARQGARLAGLSAAQTRASGDRHTLALRQQIAQIVAGSEVAQQPTQRRGAAGIRKRPRALQPSLVDQAARTMSVETMTSEAHRRSAPHGDGLPH